MSFVAFDVASLVTVGADTAATSGTAVTGGSANVKGIYAVLSASTGINADAILVHIQGVAAGVDYLVDIATGADASEVVLISNLLYSVPGNAGFGWTSYLVPVHVPSGTRLTARVQESTGSQSVRVIVTLIDNNTGIGTNTAVETCGANTADSGGTAVDAGAVAHTEGAYSQLIASTAFEYKGIVLVAGQALNATVSASATFLLSLAVGAAASEVDVLDQYPLRTSTTEHMFTNGSCFIPITIAAGSRLSAKTQCSSTDAGDRVIDVVVYGVGGVTVDGDPVGGGASQLVNAGALVG